MCRNIKTLHHFKPPATRDEVQGRRAGKKREKQMVAKVLATIAPAAR